MNKLRATGIALIVLLITAILFTACPNTAGGGGNAPAQYTVNFAVDGSPPHGTLTAAVDGTAINSGAKVQEGKTVVFTATPANESTYEVDKWTITGGTFEAGTGAEGSTSAKVKVGTANLTVKVKFKLKTAPLPEYTVNFAVDGGNGTLTAAVDGKPINTGAKVQAGKTVKFTAAPNAGYRVEQWTNGGAVIAEAGTNTTYPYTVTENADIKVKFTEILLDTAVLTLSPDKLDIKVKAVTADGSAVTVEGCTETELPSDTETELHAQGTRVTLKGKITELHCSNNQLTALNVQGLTALKGLDCWNNQLTALNVQGLTALKGLYCWNNQLTALDVQGLTALQELNCGGNQLTALNVQGLTALQGLDCEDNQLTALNVQGLSALQWLNCGGNQLTALNVQGLTALQELYCYRNQLTALDVQGLSALKRLECYGNKLTAAAFKQLFTGLPQREESDNAECILYSEQASVTEGNHTDFSTPASLKAAFDGAKGRNWKMQKQNASGSWEEI